MAYRFASTIVPLTLQSFQVSRQNRQCKSKYARKPSMIMRLIMFILI